MTLPSSGSITLAQVATELGVSLPLNLNDASVRALAGKPTGSIVLPNDLWGKSSYDGTVDYFDLGVISTNDYFNGGASGFGETVTISGLSSGTVVTLRFTVADVAIEASGGFSGANGSGSVGVERLSGSPSGYGSGSADYTTAAGPSTKTFDIAVRNGDQLRMFASGSANSVGFGEAASGNFSCTVTVTNLTVGQGTAGYGSASLSYSNTGGM